MPFNVYNSVVVIVCVFVGLFNVIVPVFNLKSASIHKVLARKYLENKLFLVYDEAWLIS